VRKTVRKSGGIERTLLDEVLALPDRVGHAHRLEPTADQRRALLAGWPIKGHGEVARLLGVSIGTAARWYREAGGKK